MAVSRVLILLLSVNTFLIATAHLLTPKQYGEIILTGEQAKFIIEYNRQIETDPKPFGYPNFNCPSLDVDPPKDIHTLSPKYVSIVAAMGDSLTAANGAKAYTLPGVALQYRGVSFSVGGDGDLKNTLTLPNIIRQYNPNLYGESKFITVSVDEEIWSQLNVGIPGSKAVDMPKQANMLVERLGKHSQYHDAWKVITMFIGANDICNCSAEDPDQLVRQWTDHVINALDILAEGLNHTFVNIVNVINVAGLRPYEYYTYCSLTHSSYCPCNMQKDKDHNETDVVIRKYQQGMYDVAKRYENRSDFTVVLQPFSQDVVIPYTHKHGKEVPDLSLLAPDCFHFSRWGHAAAASGLWNSMILPLHQKPQIIDPSKIDLLCPDPECPYLRTSVNSVSCSKKTT